MAGVTVDLSENRGTGGEAMGDRFIGIELIWGSKHADTFVAAADEDTHDIIHGDGGSDTVSYKASEIGVIVDLGDTHHETDDADVTDPDNIDFPDDEAPAIGDVGAAPGNSEGDAATNGAFGDRLGSIENVTGSDNNDRLSGDGNPNVLKGGAGNDMLGAIDVDGDGTVDSDETDAGNDRMYGGAGRDIIHGGAGADMINGGAGDDELTGGTGADTFVFAPGHGNDIINDLSLTDGDKIDLSAFNLEADDLVGMISTRGTGTNARVIINLTSVRGGTIELTEQDSLDDLDETGADGVVTDNDTIDVLNEDLFIL